MKKSSLAQILMIVTGTFLLMVGCQNNGQFEASNSSESKSQAQAILAENNPDTLVIGISNTVNSLNPIYQIGMESTYAQRFIYESILNQTGPTSFEPRLGDIKTEDNTTFTVTLNSEAYFTDGEPVTSEDVAYTLNAIAHPESLTTLGTSVNMIVGTNEAGKFSEEGMTALPGIQIIDDYTLTIETKTPTDINTLSEQLGFKVLIAPEHIFSKVPYKELNSSDIINNPEVTNGAYTFVENKDSDYIHVKANPDYYRGAPHIAEVFVRYVPGTSMMIELEAGNLDMLAGSGIAGISHDDANLLKDRAEHLIVEINPGTRIQYLIPNTRNERFQDPRVRKALSYAIDKEAAVENLLLGDGAVSAGPFPIVSSYAHPDLEPYPYDLEKAKELLEEANFDFSEPVELVVPTGNVPREALGDIVQQQLQALGMTVNQVNYDFATTLAQTREGSFDLVILGKLHSYDPDVQNYYFTGTAGNTGFYSDNKMDELIIKGKEGVTFEERYPIYLELQEYFVEQMPVVPLYVEDDYRIQKKNLVGGVAPFYEDSLSNVQNFHFEEVTE